MATHIALRLTFQVPNTTKKGLLSGLTLKHVVIHNVVAEEDFGSFFDHNVNKLSDLFEKDAREHCIKRGNVKADLAHLVKKTGVSITRHESDVRVDPHSADWI